MKKKSRGVDKGFKNKRGVILPIVAFIAFAGLVGVITLASFMAKVTYSVRSGYAAVHTAEVCQKWADNLQLYSGNVGVSCGTGKAIDTTSTNTAVTCVNPGETNSAQTVGDCTCNAVFVEDMTLPTSYGMAFTGVCGGTDSVYQYTVTINTNISKRPACAQLCPGGPLPQGATCSGDGGVSCDSCCNPGIVNPPCQTTCQNP